MRAAYTASSIIVTFSKKPNNPASFEVFWSFIGSDTEMSATEFVTCTHTDITIITSAIGMSFIGC